MIPHIQQETDISPKHYGPNFYDCHRHSTTRDMAVTLGPFFVFTAKAQLVTRPAALPPSPPFQWSLPPQPHSRHLVQTLSSLKYNVNLSRAPSCFSNTNPPVGPIRDLQDKQDKSS